MTYLVAGLLLGVFGSIHCVGMCGPILLAVNRLGSGGRQPAYSRVLAYHAARVFMYAVLGIVAGYTGTVLATAGLGRAIAIVSGAALVAVAAGVTTGRWFKAVPVAWASVVVRAGARATRLIRTHPLAGYIVLGLANGLLPCGVLYAAVAASGAVGTIGGSVILMTGFGLGTVPLLLSVGVSSVLVPVGVKRRISLAGPAAMALVGALLIARGILPPERPNPAHHLHSILSLQH
jgi:sulfite exporter TauE/SafE